MVHQALPGAARPGRAAPDAAPRYAPRRGEPARGHGCAPPRRAGALRHAPGSRVTMELYTHVTAAQQREAADHLDRALGGQPLTVTDTVDGVASSGSGSPEEGDPRGNVGSGGRTRTY